MTARNNSGIIRGRADALPLRRLAGVDPRSAPYRRGYRIGFVADRGEDPPPGSSRAELAGWLDGFDGPQVPAWRLAEFGIDAW